MIDKNIILRIKNNDETLVTLKLRYDRIGDEDVKALAEALKTNTTLTTLYLININGNRIGSEALKALAEALKTNTTLTTFKLSSNSIGAEGAKALAEVLKTNTTLNTLDLSYNSIGDEGVKALAEVLKTNTTLTTLELYDNRIGVEGVKALAEVLKTNTTLTALELRKNSIGVEGAKALAEALKTNTTLTSISFFDGISSIHTREIENYLARNQKIAECLNPLEALQEDPDSLYYLIDNDYSQHIETLKTLYPALNNSTAATDENSYLREAFAFLSALAYTTKDDMDSQLIALRILLFSFKAKKHQEIANIIRYRASHKLYITMMDVNFTKEEKPALLLLIAHGMQHYTHQEDSKTLIADTLLQLQNPDANNISLEQVVNFNQNIAILNYPQVIVIAKEALALCESQENTTGDETTLLRKLADTVEYNESVLPCLFQSPKFCIQFEKQYSQDKYILIEDVCSKRDFKEKEVPKFPSVVTEEQVTELQKTLFDSQEMKITENIEKALQNIEDVCSKKNLNETEIHEEEVTTPPSFVTEEKTKEVEKSSFDSQVLENIGANEKRNDNSLTLDKKSVIGKTLGLMLLGLGASIVIAGIATLFATASTISLPLSASLIGFGGILLTSGFMMFEANQKQEVPLNSNTKSRNNRIDQKKLEQIVSSSGRKITPLFEHSNNKQSFFSKGNTENSKLLKHEQANDSTKRPVFKKA